MKALITGGGGFAGSHLARQLLSAGHQVLSVGVGKGPHEQKDFYVDVDLMDTKQVSEELDFSDIDWVFHLAGLTNVAESFEEPVRYFNINTTEVVDDFHKPLEIESHKIVDIKA